MAATQAKDPLLDYPLDSPPQDDGGEESVKEEIVETGKVEAPKPPQESPKAPEVPPVTPEAKSKKKVRSHLAHLALLIPLSEGCSGGAWCSQEG